MILDLDIGNTLSKWRLKDRDTSSIRARGAMWTRDEWRSGADIPDLEIVDVIRISNVARQDVLEDTVRLLKRRVGAIHVAHSTPEALGIRNGYETPERLGVDRWLGVLSGYQLTGGCCTVDCGSAITMDAVLPSGQHLGGYIIPGLRLMKESLKLGTRKIVIDPEEEALHALSPGTNTVDAVNHGVFMAAISAINRLYMELCDSQNMALPLLITGGDAPLISKGLRLPHACWPDMVYAGLEVLFPLTPDEKRGLLAGMPEVMVPADLTEMRKALAFTQML
ncbi:type III pantothenate kinase [Kushneria marisflavi]|uniref:Type III pantothenate kinase n=1 Tax=Kushneria marisflavi TaxID=157779 RepID=A0A240URE0_9GAMM|nr:type III pantothenate kinase [Kushneria marisflavi]ART63590.1 type III pantothenate kinase [Kushneria marisflavi]RKD85253.1 type III pantothenate kinase [Kushneria marisflavi]